ncbi:MAG TPA: histone [Candidatus Lokiarchaeia archaeon]|nr:histone [Candidatus Lokiarchaeia archaeon]
MPSHERIIPLAAIDRIFLKAGCNAVDSEATKELGRLLESIGFEILETAVLLQAHVGRKTIFGTDVRLAFEHWQAKKTGEKTN